MENYSLKDEIIKNLEERQDSRKKFHVTQPIIAACRTRDSKFDAFIQDVSSSGVFIKTTRNLLAGQIAERLSQHRSHWTGVSPRRLGGDKAEIQKT
jgi:hypothetical protein